MATEFWSPAQVIFGLFVFSFQFLVLASLEYWQNGLYKLSNEIIQQIWSEKNKFWQRFDIVRKSKTAAMKIQDGALVTSCDMRYDSSNRYLSYDA